MGLTFQTRIREGHAGLGLPEFPGIFDPEQRHPFSETRRWIDNIFDVNDHLRRIGNYEKGGQIVFPPTATLALQGIRRSGLSERIYRAGAVTRVRAHSILATPQKAQSDLDEYLDLREVGNQYGIAIEHTGDALFYGNSFDEHKAREKLQDVMQNVLVELGYGSPDEFSANSITYGEYSEAHPRSFPSRHHRSVPIASTLKDYS
jgi:hypothetical protein